MSNLEQRLSSVAQRISEAYEEYSFDDATTAGGLRKAAVYNGIIGASFSEFLFAVDYKLAVANMAFYVSTSAFLFFKAYQEDQEIDL